MKKTSNRNLLCAAIAAVSLTAIPAFGQLRAGQDGHSNDASNRVGSGGYNSAGSVYNNGLSGGVSGNNLIYNDVTGLSGFRGPVFERDPRAFMGPTSSTALDNAVRISSGAPTPYQPPMMGNSPTAFYGGNRDVAPPIGTERIGFTQSYLGTDLTPSNPFSLGSDINAALDVQRQQLGEANVIGANSKFLDNGNPNSATDQAGPLEATTAANNYLGSPLYGVQGAGADAGTDAGIPIFATPSSSSTGTDRFRSHESEVDKMRSELLQNGLDDQQQQSLNGSNQTGNQDNNNGQPLGSIPNRSLDKPLEGPNSNGIKSNERNSAMGNGSLSGGIDTQQGTRQRMQTLMSPQQQSKQYNVLAQRLAQLTPSLVRTQQADALFHTEENLQRANAANGKTPGGPTSRPAMGFGPGAFAAPSAPNPDLQPLKIDSLADGVTAPGLHGLLIDAEKLMKEGKFENAIKKYNVAARVAPNNGLIPLGRANAELAAGYYYQASADLHQVFQADPALLMGQYALQNWIKDERLQFITKELNDLSKADPKQETPAFLLAYISYNTGHESAAESYLSEAHRRAGAQDPLLGQLQSHWKLSATPAIEGNK
jgi:tetratricopeptide (TPR) repeat protein